MAGTFVQIVIIAFTVSFIAYFATNLQTGDEISELDTPDHLGAPDESDVETSVATKANADPGQCSGTTFDEETRKSVHIPLDLKCDACKIVAFKLFEGFQNATEKFKGGIKRKFKESEILDIVEDVCTDEKYTLYGLKDVKNGRRLVGPGIEMYNEKGLWKGGMWPFRLQKLCLQLTGEVGEYDIHDAWHAGHSLTDFICYNQDIGSICRETGVAAM